MRRPRLVLLLALAMFALAAYNLAGVVGGVQRYTVLRDLPLTVPPAYLIVSRAGWALAFAGVGAGLWRVRRWARWGALLALALYLGQGWFDRLAWAQSDYARTSAPFHLALHLLALALLAGMLWWRPIRRAFSAEGDLHS